MVNVNHTLFSFQCFKYIFELIHNIFTATLFIYKFGGVTEAESSAHVGQYMECIDKTFEAIEYFSKCSNDALYKAAMNDSLETLRYVFGECREKGGARILAGKREYYESLVRGIRIFQMNFCSQYLQEAQERECSYDERLKEDEMKSWFHSPSVPE